MANHHASIFLLLLLSFSVQTSESIQTSSEICNGRDDILCSSKMRFFTFALTLIRLEIDLILGVPNKLLKTLALDRSAAEYWIRNNVVDFADRLKLRYLIVGYEIQPGDPAKAPFLLQAMRNLHAELRSAGLDDRIKVSTAVDAGLLRVSDPPSAGEFGEAAARFVGPIAGFLIETRSPILVNVYRYLRVDFDGRRVSYRESFNASEMKDIDHILNPYDESVLEAMSSALERIDGGDLEIMVAECDWRPDGGGGENDAVTIRYCSSLTDYVKNGTSNV